MFNIEKAIKNWIKLFRKHKEFDQGVIQEMELHLRDHIDDLKGEGFSDQEAFERAVSEFGDIPKVAEEEYTNIKRKLSFRSVIHYFLLRNYFKSSFRGLIKNPLTSFINVFGLSVAIGISLVVYSFIEFDSEIDAFHEHKEQVYLATYFVDREGSEEQYGLSPAPLGEAMQIDFPSISQMCRVKDQQVVIKNDDKVFHENVRFVDSSFLDMFTFPLKWGNSNSLRDVNSIVISEAMAIKYFGEQNPVGQELFVKYDKNIGKSYQISGVAKKLPSAHVISFDFLVPFDNIKFANPDFDLLSWKNTVNATLIRVDEKKKMEAIAEGMTKYIDVQNQIEKDWPIAKFKFEKLAGLHLRSRDIRDDISQDSFYEGRVVLPILAILMLLLACFNYINIAIVSAAKRLKEIGLRKVIGASRKTLVIQFLTENIFITCLALFTGFVLAYFVFLPWFADLSSIDLTLSLLKPNLWIFLIAIVILTGTLSGIYPAFYISKFEVIKIFKGTVQFGKKNTLTKIFLGIQLILACTGITGAIMFSKNSEYQANRSWGYNQKEALYAEIENRSNYHQLANSLESNPNVLSISGSSNHLGKGLGSAVIHLTDRDFEVMKLGVDANYLNTMGLRLHEGRFFIPHQESDRNKIVVNELLANSLGKQSSIGQTLKIAGKKYEVIGVVKNFHSYNFYNESKPIIFEYIDDNAYQYLSMKVKSGKEAEAYASLKENWVELFPETPFSGGYQEDVWGSFYEELQVMKKFMKTVAYIAVLLASLGLYGLVTLNVSGRAREFSIRKVLGAGSINIAHNIIKQYILLALIALAVGAPISYLLIKANIDLMFPTPVPMGFTNILLAVFILITVLLTVILVQIRRVINSNPVDGLKVE